MPLPEYVFALVFDLLDLSTLVLNVSVICKLWNKTARQRIDDKWLARCPEWGQLQNPDRFDKIRCYKLCLWRSSMPAVVTEMVSVMNGSEKECKAMWCHLVASRTRDLKDCHVAAWSTITAEAVASVQAWLQAKTQVREMFLASHALLLVLSSRGPPLYKLQQVKSHHISGYTYGTWLKFLSKLEKTSGKLFLVSLTNSNSITKTFVEGTPETTISVPAIIRILSNIVKVKAKFVFDKTSTSLSP